MTNEELRQEIEKLKQEIIELRFNQLESKCEPIPTSYQVKIPADLENYYTIDYRWTISLHKRDKSIILSAWFSF